MDNIKNPEYVEKERARTRKKYYRLGYKNVYKHAHPETKQVSKNLKKILNIPVSCEIHHWNYNFLYDVFILDKRVHARLHKVITFDEKSKCFMYNGILLDSKEEHEKAIREINNIHENIEIFQFKK